MSILNILLLVIGLITVLICIVAYKRRTLIIEAIKLRQQSNIALKEFEDGLYKEAYLQALHEELPKVMWEKAVCDIQTKYNIQEPRNKQLIKKERIYHPENF